MLHLSGSDGCPLCLAGVKELLQTDEAECLKVTATGLKVFERQESKVRVVSLVLK